MSGRAKRGWGGMAWAALPILFLAFALFLPLGEVFRLGLRAEGGWTADRLRELLADPYVRGLLRFTFEQALLSTALSLVLGFPLGWLLTRYRFPGREALRAATLVPFVLPPITVALGFILFFGHAGYLNGFLQGLLGLSEPPVRVLYTLWGIVLAHAFYNAPVVARFVHASWEAQDPSQVEAARVLGAGRLRAFLTVTLPGLVPGLLSACALVFLLCTLSFAIPLALGGAQYATIEVGVYHRARVEVDLPGAAALALVVLAFSLLLTYLYLRGGGLVQARTAREREQPAVPLLDRKRPGRLLWVLYLLPAALLFLGPIGAVVADSFLRPAPGGRSPTLHWYGIALSADPTPFLGASPLGSILTSLGVALAAAGGALALGLAVVAALRRLRSRALETLLMAPLGVSSVVLGLALLLAFRRPPLSLLPSGPLPLAVAHVLLTYPFVVRAVGPLWESLDPHLAEAARTLGASRLRAFLTVELPLLRPGLLLAGALAFSLSLGEMTAAAMLARPGVNTIPLAIYQFLSARRFGAASAMATLLMAATAVVVWAWDRAGSRWLGRTRA
ncbi:MAG: iron ABC transporter permease [Candidatus Bipolaricaulota bacterium]|nr:iron ABC transporter permease [Candidatus Bipolaricaulota bacterium]